MIATRKMKRILFVIAAIAGVLLVLAMLFSLAASAYPLHVIFGLLTVLAVVFVLQLKRQPRRHQAGTRIHFPGLNALRFFAAAMVIVHHTEQGKALYGLDTLWDGKSFWSPLCVAAGDFGVSFFFVLSGFLITYLLLAERRETGSICLKEFYVRRALRIWPLYYALTLFCFLILPYFSIFHVPNMWNVLDAQRWSRFSLFLFMWVPVTFFVNAPGIFAGGVLWTASVEEHFYFLWPLIIRRLKSRILFALVGIVILLVILKNPGEISAFVGLPLTPRLAKPLGILANYCHFFRIDCMAIGGIGAWVCLEKRHLLNFLFHWSSQVILGLILSYCLITGKRFGMWDDDIYAALFLAVILNVAINAQSFLKLENPVLDFLGRISYGLYAYNWLTIAVTINLMKRFGSIHGLFLRNLYIYATSVFFLIALSSASYYLMERKFLRLKRRFGSLSLSKLPTEAEDIRGYRVSNIEQTAASASGQ
jgi:peptidoglycan/LPS O-acetylase OafA/YrhL